MNITKRVLALLLVLFLMFGNVTPAMATGLEGDETVVVEEPTEAPTEEPTEAPTEEPTEAPTEAISVEEGAVEGTPAQDSAVEQVSKKVKAAKEVDTNGLLAQFTFPEKQSSGWQDGSDVGASKSYTSTNGTYSLNLSNCSKIYSPANDANGIGFLKFGTSSAVGTMTFTVPDEVDTVVLHLAGYKAKTSKYSVNDGAAATLTNAAAETDDVYDYDEVTVDTSTNKTVTVATVSGATRMVMYSVLFYGDEAGGTTPEPTEPEVTEPEVTEPEVTEPEVTEPEVTEPEVTEPEVTEPEVTEPSGEVTTASMTFEASNRVSYSTSQQVWQANGITLTNDKGSSTSNVGDYKAPIRLYKSSTVKIEYPGMSKIAFTANGTDYASALEASLAGLGTIVTDAKVVTLVLESASGSIEFVTTAQIRLDEITVYTNDFTVPEPAPTEPSTDPEVDTVLTIADAIALGASKEHNSYTTGKYYVTGIISEVYDASYGNMYITDEAGNKLTIYGTYSADGSTRYSGMDVKPVAGDTVTVYGILGQYNGTAQMKNGWITEHIPGEGTPDVTEPENNDPEPETTLTIADAIALGESKEHNVYTDGKYYVTGVITEVYNETYGNMYIADDEGNTLCIYGTYSADGETRYDAMETKPVAGDTVTIYGKIGQFNGTAQIKNGWITEHIPVPPVGTEENPIEVIFDDNGDATFTIPANTTHYFCAYNVAGMVLTVNGGSEQLLEGNPRMPVSFTVTNETDAAAEFVLHVAFPVGDQMNPEALYLGEQNTVLAAGDNDGYYYTYTAEANGTLEFVISSVAEEIVADITVSNMTSYAQKSMLYDAVDGVLSVDVAEGDELSIIVAVMPDASWNVPAAEIAWNVNYTAGSDMNPFSVEFVMNETYTEGEAVVAVPANTTFYFQSFGIGGMELTVNGGEPVLLEGNPRMPVMFSVTNDTEYDAEYTLHIAYPVGHQMNPSNLNVYTEGESYDLLEAQNVAWVNEGSQGGYLFTWIAPMDGALTIELNNGKAGWAYVVNNLTAGIYGDMHYSCEVPAVNAQTIRVNAGDEIQIMVNSCGASLDSAEPTPAGQIYFNAYYIKDAGTESNPYIVEFAWNENWTEGTAEVTVPANTTTYIGITSSGMLLTINGGEPIAVNGSGWMPEVHALVNDTEEDKVFTLVLAYPAGSMENPADLVIGENSCEIEENSWNGYTYEWIATDSGELTITMGADVASWSYVVNNLTSYYYSDNHTSSDEFVVASETIFVKKGDQVQIVINTAMDYDTWTSPAGTVSFTASFVPSVGAESNPEILNMEEMEWSGWIGRSGELFRGDSYYYSATLMSDMNLFLWGDPGMIVVVNGVEYVFNGNSKEITIPGNPDEPTIIGFILPEDGVSDYGWYSFEFSYIYGSLDAPANMVIGKNSIKLPANHPGYVYSYFADQTGYLTITMNTTKNWVYQIGVYGWTWNEETQTESLKLISEYSHIYGDGGAKSQTVYVEGGNQVYVVVSTKNAKAATISFTAAFVSKNINVAAGKSTTLSFTNPSTGKKVDASKVNWQIVHAWSLKPISEIVGEMERVDIAEAEIANYATINKDGKFTAKAVALTEPVYVQVEAALKSNAEVTNTFVVVIRPVVTELQINQVIWNHEIGENIVVENVNGKTLDFCINRNESFYLDVVTDPAIANREVTWKSSNTKVLKVDKYGNLLPVYNSKTGKYATGTVTLTATAKDGSGVKATVKVKVSMETKDVHVTTKNNQWVLGSGKSVTLTANLETWFNQAPTNKNVTWSMMLVEDMVYDEETGEYVEVLSEDLSGIATLSSKGVLKAASGLDKWYSVKVTATAQDTGVSGDYYMELAPVAKTIEINNVPTTYDVNSEELIYPEACAWDATHTYGSGVKWTTSNSKIARIIQIEEYNWEYGYYEIRDAIEFTGKTGKVKLTATATDGSGVKKTVTVNVVKSPNYVKLSKNSAILASGKSLTLKATVGLENYNWETDTSTIDTKTITNKNVTWSFTEETKAAADAIGAKISKGKLTFNAKKYKALYDETGAYVTLTIKATANLAHPWTGAAEDYCDVTITPATTKVNIYRFGQTVTGKTLKMDDNAVMVLSADALPETTADEFTWKSSNTKIATVAKNPDGSITVQPTGKLGTVTITAKAADGTGKSATVKVKVVRKVDELTVNTNNFALSGTKKGRSFDLNKLVTVSPSNASSKTLTWSIAPWSADLAKTNKITLSSSGKLTSKLNVTAPVTISVMAKAADGLGAKTEYFDVTVTPATTKVTITAAANQVTVGESVILSADAEGEFAADKFTWKSSSTKIAKVTVNEDGSVSVVGVKAGTAKITATAKDGSGKSATVTVKVVKATPAT